MICDGGCGTDALDGQAIQCPCCTGVFCTTDCMREWHAEAALQAVLSNRALARLQEDNRRLQAEVMRLTPIPQESDWQPYRPPLLNLEEMAKSVLGMKEKKHG